MAVGYSVSQRVSCCRYEWACSGQPEASQTNAPGTAVQQLELVQCEMLAPESFSQWPLRLSLHGGAACTNFVLTGSLRVSVYAPEATAKRAYRMVLKGDMQRVFALLQSEATVPSPQDSVWRQRIIGTSVAYCLKRVCLLPAAARVKLRFCCLLHSAKCPQSSGDTRNVQMRLGAAIGCV